VSDPVVAAEVRECAEDHAIDEDPARRLVTDRDQGGNERHPGQGEETEADESQDDQARCAHDERQADQSVPAHLETIDVVYSEARG